MDGKVLYSAHLSHTIGPGAFAWDRLMGTQGILGRVYGHQALRTAQPGRPGGLVRHISPCQEQQSHLHAYTSSHAAACTNGDSLHATLQACYMRATLPVQCAVFCRMRT